MKVIGSKSEIVWIKNALQNSCLKCPFAKECVKQAQQDVVESGHVEKTCDKFLDENILFIIE